jgi:hypothetical protein
MAPAQVEDTEDAGLPQLEVRNLGRIKREHRRRPAGASRVQEGSEASG